MILESKQKLTPKHASVGAFALEFSRAHADLPILMAKRNGHYEPIFWGDFWSDVEKIAAFLIRSGHQPGQRGILFSSNRCKMLKTELALMSVGMISVPLFAGYRERMINRLIAFSEGDLMFVCDSDHLRLVDPSAARGDVVVYDEVRDPGLKQAFEGRLVDFEQITSGELSQAERGEVADRIRAVRRHDLALMMYTSGTMSFPKGVLLTHGNILSQQEALDVLWRVEPGNTMLSYLPWHHSFGGIFEKFFALYSGTAVYLDDSLGKDINLMVANWRQAKPNFFFSVPKIYYELVTRSFSDRSWESDFFHGDLRFVFTAAAPLAANISAAFTAKKIPVLEGWGLTETSPCCTLTDGVCPRRPGLVGKPIPGVHVKLAADRELLIKGPNVMRGYFKNDEANAEAFTADGWFRTGDVGNISPDGVEILTRKDRIFKLANAEKVNPASIENEMLETCPLLKHVLVFGSEMDQICALAFPNHDVMKSHYGDNWAECRKPQTVGQLAGCLRGCLKKLNENQDKRYETIGACIIIDRELDIEKGELTPSMKLNPSKVVHNYWAYVQPLIDRQASKPEGAYYIDL